MLESVVQEETTGCGIASVANILDMTYAEAKAIADTMGIHASDSSLCSDTEYVRRMLSSAGVETSNEEIPFESWHTLPDLALLSIKHHQEEVRHFLALGCAQAREGSAIRFRFSKLSAFQHSAGFRSNAAKVVHRGQKCITWRSSRGGIPNFV